jgi:hypothetical protein
MALRRSYTPEVYNTGRGKTVSAGSNLKGYVRKEYQESCAVCGTKENVTVSHILKHKIDCEKLRIPWDATNFLTLCGTEGQVGSCYDLFDTFQMSFVHTATTMQWSVVGGGAKRHGKLVNLATNPRKRALHSHFTRCMLNKSLIGMDEESHSSPEDLNVSDDSVEII